MQFGVSNLVSMNYTIKNPAPGVWQAVVDGTALTVTQSIYNLTVFGDSSVALIPQTGALFNLGQDVVVNSGLVDLSNSPAAPIQNAAMTARVQFTPVMVCMNLRTYTSTMTVMPIPNTIGRTTLSVIRVFN